MEFRLEDLQGYRFLCTENSKGLTAVWGQLEQGELKRSRLREAAAAARLEDLRNALATMPEQAELQHKASELSVGKRAVPVGEARAAALAGFNV